MLNKEIIIQILKQLLEKQKKNNWALIEDINCLNTIFSVCKCYFYPQSYGPLIQKKIIQLYGWIHLEPHKCQGDIQTKNYNIELKVSLGGQTNDRFHFAQLRQSHKIDFYVFIAYRLTESNYQELGELFIFKMDKKQILPFLANGFSHRTKQEWSKNPFGLEEKYIQVKYDSVGWHNLLKYRISLQDFRDL